MKLQFERAANGAICAVLTAPGECDRIITVDCASDAIDALGLSINAAALKPLDALFALPRVVCVEIEQRGDRWRVEVAYWHNALGTLTQYEMEAASLVDALARCVRTLAG